MTSLGEIELLVDSSIVGKIRVLGIAADPAIFPRLAISIGVTLHERRDDPRSPIPAPAKLEMREASGELRLSESADAIGAVVCIGAIVG